MRLIYVCSPYRGETKKDIKKNIKNARMYCRYVCEHGGIPLAPHLLFPQFLNDADPTERRLGLRMGIMLLACCEELWVFGKPSIGMAGEIAWAMKLGILIRWLDSKEVKGRDE